MNTVNNQKDCYPTPEQELLLKAALLRDRDAILAWEKWRSNVDIGKLDPGSHRLLPLLYQNLRMNEITDPLMGVLKRVYDLTWYQNQQLLHLVAPILCSFHNAGIVTMLLKGAALILLYYKDHGLRPMGDVDILVHTEQASEAINLLRKLGWKPNPGSWQVAFTESYVSAAHAHGFRDASDRELDLHWHVLHECCRADADNGFWDKAVSVKLYDVSTHALTPTDQLLHVCVHGAKWDSTPPFRWVADAMTIINSSQSEIDWNRLITLAEDSRLILPVRDALHYLSDKFAVPIPQATLQIFREMRTSRMEHIEYNYRSQSHIQKPLGYLPFLWFNYSRLAGNSVLPLKLIGFIKYMRSYWGVEHLWQLPFYAISMAMRRIKNWYKSG
jgi:hypothetical protein